MVDLGTVWRRLLTARCCECGLPFDPHTPIQTRYADPICLPCRVERGSELYADGQRSPS